MQLTKLSILIVLFSLFTHYSFSQVSSSDMKTFGQNLNLRRNQNVGANPNSRDFVQVPFGPLNYKGVKQISSKFMEDIYLNQDIRLVMGLFSTVGLDKVVFDKYILQLFLYADNEKELTTQLINVMCGDAALSRRIYEKYYAVNSKKIKDRLEYNPYEEEIKERNE